MITIKDIVTFFITQFAEDEFDRKVNSFVKKVNKGKFAPEVPNIVQNNLVLWANTKGTNAEMFASNVTKLLGIEK